MRNWIKRRNLPGVKPRWFDAVWLLPMLVSATLAFVWLALVERHDEAIEESKR